jgi:hypothetical protein
MVKIRDGLTSTNNLSLYPERMKKGKSDIGVPLPGWPMAYGGAKLIRLIWGGNQQFPSK